MATVASRGNCFPELKLVEDWVKTAPASQKILALPVFFANLDQADIPSPDQLESCSLDTGVRVGCGVLSLNGVFQLRLPEDAGTSLWPRVWSWISFIHENWQHLPAVLVAVMPEASFYAQFLVFAAWFLGHPPTCSLMSATPGFRFMLARAWVLFPQLNGPDDAHSFEPRLSSLCCCIATFDFVNPANVAEMIDGAGGSIDDLARLVIQYTDDVFGAERSRTIESNAGYFRGLLKFL